MYYNIKAMLLPSLFLDSSCYSDEYFEPPHRRPIPDAFDSTENFTTSVETDSNSMPRSVHKPVNVSLPAIGPLPSIPGHKAPRPALPRPLYISAYTQPSTYAEYIKTVLSTPLTGSNVGCSSVDPMLDSAAMAHIRKEKGLQFADLITHELNMAIPHARDLWVRNTICGEAVPPDFEKHFRAHYESFLKKK